MAFTSASIKLHSFVIKPVLVGEDIFKIVQNPSSYVSLYATLHIPSVNSSICGIPLFGNAASAILRMLSVVCLHFVIAILIPFPPGNICS